MLPHHRADGMRNLVFVPSRDVAADQEPNQAFAKMDILFGRFELKRVEPRPLPALQGAVRATKRP